LCDYNDFALVKIDPADVAKVNPSVPGFGGPAGLGGSSATGDRCVLLRKLLAAPRHTFLSPKQGKVVTTVGGGWSRTVYTATPGIPGDSGSGFLNDTGGAIGTLSTVAIAPLAGSNGVAALGRELDYANASGTPAALESGTEPFTPDVVGAIAGGG